MEKSKRIQSGDEFEFVTALKRIPRTPGKCDTKWLCRCKCGNICVLKSGYLRGGGIYASCGCQKSNRLHGLSKFPIYFVWVKMIARCTDPSHVQFKSYGGRGIT